jgi:hypothetical protein
MSRTLPEIIDEIVALAAARQPLTAAQLAELEELDRRFNALRLKQHFPEVDPVPPQCDQWDRFPGCRLPRTTSNATGQRVVTCRPTPDWLEGMALLRALALDAGDDDAFVPMRWLLSSDCRFDTDKAIRKALDRNKNTIRTRRPQTAAGKPDPHRLEVHLGDWKRFLARNPARRESDPLDVAPVAEAALQSRIDKAHTAKAASRRDLT